MGNLFLGHVDFGETERTSVHRRCDGVCLVTAESHHVGRDNQLISFLMGTFSRGMLN